MFNRIWATLYAQNALLWDFEMDKNEFKKLQKKWHRDKYWNDRFKEAYCFLDKVRIFLPDKYKDTKISLVDGYMVLKRNKKVKIHHLIYNNCFENAPNGFEIHHINHEKLENHPDNLIAIPPFIHRTIHFNENVQIETKREIIEYMLFRKDELFQQIQEIKERICIITDKEQLKKQKKWLRRKQNQYKMLNFDIEGYYKDELDKLIPTQIMPSKYFKTKRKKEKPDKQKIIIR